MVWNRCFHILPWYKQRYISLFMSYDTLYVNNRREQPGYCWRKHEKNSANKRDCFLILIGFWFCLATTFVFKTKIIITVIKIIKIIKIFLVSGMLHLTQLSNFVYSKQINDWLNTNKINNITYWIIETTGPLLSPTSKTKKTHSEKVSYIFSRKVFLIFQEMELSSPKIKKCLIFS